MPHYTYTAIRADGTLTDGSLDAKGRQDALQHLDRQALRPVNLREQPAGAHSPASPSAAPTAPDTSGSALSWRRHRVTAKALEAFTRQLASLLEAGVPLADALQLLASESPDAAGRDAWTRLHADVVDGASLAQAMEHQPTVFPRVYAAMVQAGETGGFLSVVLRQIADFQTRDRDLRGKVASALIYPAILAVLSMAVVAFLMVFFIPRFDGIFQDFGAALPPLTRAIVGISKAAQHWGWLLPPAAIVAYISLRGYLASTPGRLARERLVLRLPVIGSISARYALTRFARMLGTLTHAGVPLIQALRVARESLGNATLSAAVDQAIHRVQHGEALGVSLAACPQLFGRTIIAMVTVAERAGRLDAELIRLADDGERELDRQLRAAVALTEPALLFIMAAVVGTIVIGMVLPIFAIQDYIK